MFPITWSVIWLTAIVGFAIVEGVTVGLVSIWFCAGALVAFAASLLGANVWTQFALFIAVSFIALIAVRPMARKLLIPKRQATNADRVLGMEGVVTQAVDNLKGEGQVNLKGQVWTARSSEGQTILPGTKVRVLRIEGVKVFVTPAAGPGPAEAPQ
ncbi:MAG: NfeD family protein [Oscillospiraceae bacterium]|nr:NfeD family protein [Oscillospiraceae bacterium]